jgi:hypothetical protein
LKKNQLTFEKLHSSESSSVFDWPAADEIKVRRVIGRMLEGRQRECYIT